MKFDCTALMRIIGFKSYSPFSDTFLPKVDLDGENHRGQRLHPS